jgi:hypothetical protein
MAVHVTVILLLLLVLLVGREEGAHITRKFPTDPAKEGQRWMTYINHQPWKAQCWDSQAKLFYQLACTVDLSQELKSELAFSLTACILNFHQRPPLLCEPDESIQVCAEGHGYAYSLYETLTTASTDICSRMSQEDKYGFTTSVSHSLDVAMTELRFLGRISGTRKRKPRLLALETALAHSK